MVMYASGTPRDPTEASMRLRKEKAFHLCAGLLLPLHCCGFRIFNESTDFFEPVFTPHQKGSVGYYGEPTNLKRERVNEGAAATSTFPRQAEDVKARQNCLNMIGPLGDGKYYCRGKEYGYCDRRSGTCFCNQGYQGLDCFKCAPTHDRRGTLCYPKKKCPSDCSGAGECDYATGQCRCESHRGGADCSLRVCQAFHQFCLECTESSCVRCIEGWFVNTSAVENVCTPCTFFDPRCTVCDSNSCLQCGDPLLLSVRRSGRREHDPQLSYDELTRDLSQEHPFGTQQAEAFDEAESFHLSGNTKPLHQTAMECAYWVPDLYICDLQSKKYPKCDPYRTGSPDEVEHSNWGCSDWTVSHVVCGNAGTIGFSSPSYAVEEGSGFVQLTVRRTGGGMGEVQVQFALRHRSTGASDVSLPAYKAEQTLTFREGVVELSFIMSIHDDLIREPDETFTLTLRAPTGGAVLGPQKVAVVTIMDDDAAQTRPDFCTVHDLKLVNTAGETNHFRIQAVSASRLLQNRGANRFEVEIINTPPAILPDIAPHPTANGIGVASAASGRPMVLSDSIGGVGHYSLTDIASSRIPQTHGARTSTKPWAVGNTSVIDNHDGTYNCTWQIDRQGVYSVMVRQAVPYGLVGEYFDNIYLEGPPAFTRVDREINFQWGHGRITSNAADFVAVRWRGKVQGPHTGVTTFEVFADDHARLWVDGVLLVDRWDVKCGAARGKLRLEKDRLYDLVLEYRELRGAASVELRWCYPSTDSCSPVHVHAKYLFQMYNVAGSPFPNVQVRSAPTRAAESVARGIGLWHAVAGVTTHFEIYPRDRFGNQQQLSIAVDDRFHAVAKMVRQDPNGDAEGGVQISNPTYPVTLIYNEDAMQQTDEDCHQPVGNATTPATQSLECRRGVTGDRHYTHRFVAQYTPQVSGLYDLGVMLGPGDDHIYGSPFRVRVAPAHTSAFVSRVWGAGRREGTTGELALLRIEAHDAFGNLRQEGGDLFEVHAYHNGVKTYVHDDLADSQAAQDASWSYRRSLPEVVIGTVAAVAGAPGTYDAAFRPLLKGSYKLAVTLNGLHVGQSPYDLAVQTSAVEPRACPAWGQGIASATSDVTATFDVELRDAFNNHIVDGDGLKPSVTLTGTTIPNDTPLSSLAPPRTGDCVYRNDHFRCTYQPRSAGRHKLAVHIRNRHIRGSPFIVIVSPGDASGETSTASGQGLYSGRAGEVSRFTVQAKDVSYNTKRVGGDTFTATLRYYDGAVVGINNEISGGKAAQITSVNPNYLDNGRYEFTFTPHVRGNYKLEVMLDGRHVVGSPFYPYVSPTLPSAARSALSGSGLLSGEAGYLSRVVADVHDAFGNHLEFGGAQLVAKYVYLGGHSTDADAAGVSVNPQYAHIHDFGNGSYDLSYTPVHAGRWRAEVSVWTPGGLNSSLHNSADDDVHTLFEQTPAVVQSTDASIQFDWGAGSYSPGGAPSAAGTSGMRHDQWGGRWEGKLRAPHSENFTFYVTTSVDDGARLTIDGEVIIDAWTTDGKAGVTATTHSAFLPLVAGHFYTIDVYFRDLLGPASLTVEWESASTPRAPVPATALYRLLRLGGAEPVADVAPTITSAAACFAEGSALASATAGVPAAFTIHARDIFGNERLRGGDVFRVEATGNGADRFAGVVTDLGDGSYAVSYTPQAVGHYSLAVTYNAPAAHRDLGAYQVAHSLLHSHVRGSPFAVTVHPGVTDAASSAVLGDGLLSCVAGATASVIIQSKDARGNDRDTGADQWQVALSGPIDAAGSAARVGGTAVARAMGSGRYESLYTPVVAGIYDLAVTLAGAHAAGSPFRVHVRAAAAHAPSCVAEGSALSAADAGANMRFTVTAVDAFGNARAEAGDEFVARLYGSALANASQDVRLISEGPQSGVYVGTYQVPTGAVGRYELSIALANGPAAGLGGRGLGGAAGLRSGGGLIGYYYNNQWLRGTPEHSQVDPSIAFDWGEGPITSVSSDLVSVRWTGYLKAEFTEDYTFSVDVDDAVRVIIGGVVIIDTASSTEETSFDIVRAFSNTMAMEAGVLREIIVEYREDRGAAHLTLLWSSDRLAQEVIPPSLLYPGSSAIRGSPFSITIS